MIICPSIAPTTTSDAITSLRSIGKGVNLVEVRIDDVSDLDLKSLLRKPRPKVIITLRAEEEGGNFRGPRQQQIQILSSALELGADYIDIELTAGKENLQHLRTRHSSSNIIVSYHNFKETPPDLDAIYDRMRATGMTIIKIAAMANDISDSARMLKLVQRAKKERQKIIALCMGERGQVTRILPAKFGGLLTFASPQGEEPTAPGQFSVEDLKKNYRIHTLDSKTKIFGLVGNPVSQSKGIYFHNHAFQRRRINAVYVNLLVDNLGTFVATFTPFLNGFSVTMPFKREIASFTDRLDPEAKTLGVVNTILIRRNGIMGYNTDLPAIISLLPKKQFMKNKRVTVLGTGGTAKTMGYAAVKNNASVTIVGRSRHKAQVLADELGCTSEGLENLTEIHSDILMNGTSVGMNGSADVELYPKTLLRRGMVVFDAVYAPIETILIRNARTAGCRVITGEQLFKQQALLQSKLFVGSLA